MPAQDGAPAGQSIDLGEATIELEPPPPEPTATAERATASAEPSTVLGSASLRATVTGHGPAGGVEAPPVPSASAEPVAADGTWTFNPTTTAAPSSTGGLSNDALASAMNAGIGAVVAEDKRKREGFARSHNVLPNFTAHDLALGMVPGGELVTLTRDLVRRSLTPDNGRALLQFDTDGKGVLSSVRVLDASSGRPEWDQIANQILQSARGTTFRVPGGANGLNITLEVTSQLKTVNGSAATGRSTLGKVWGAISDPLGTAADSTVPPQRVVATRIVDVRAF